MVAPGSCLKGGLAWRTTATDDALRSHGESRLDMFNPRTMVIDAFVAQLQRAYRRDYGTLEPGPGEILGWIGHTALEHIASSIALFQAFTEMGQAERMGYGDPGDLREGYPASYCNNVHPFVAPQMRALELTQEGRQWIANLRSHLFEIEHDTSG